MVGPVWRRGGSNMAASLLVNYSLRALSGCRQRGWSVQWSLAARLTVSVSWVVEPTDESNTGDEISLVLFTSYLMSLSVYFFCTDSDHTCLSLCLSVCSCRWLTPTTGAASLARWWRSAPTGRTARRRGLWSWLHRAQEAPLCFSSRVTVACAPSSVPPPPAPHPPTFLCTSCPAQTVALAPTDPPPSVTSFRSTGDVSLQCV